MTYKQIETSREIRQWVKTGVGLIIGVNIMFPNAKYAIRDKYRELKENFKKEK